MTNKEFTLSSKQKKLVKQVTGFKFKLYVLMKLPMGLLANLKVEKLTADECITSVPFNWLTKNPFKSMYFAVQSMAAELSTASTCLLAVRGKKPSVAFIIVNCKANFFKKATSRVYFTCSDAGKAFEAVEKCIENKAAETVTFKTVGKMIDGTVVSEFEFTWSFRQRSNS